MDENHQRNLLLRQNSWEPECALFSDFTRPTPIHYFKADRAGELQRICRCRPPSAEEGLTHQRLHKREANECNVQRSQHSHRKHAANQL